LQIFRCKIIKAEGNNPKTVKDVLRLYYYFGSGLIFMVTKNDDTSNCDNKDF